MSGIAQGEPFDIYVRCGDRYELIVEIFEDDGVTPADTTGWTGQAQARDKSGNLLCSFSVTADAGIVRMKATSTATATITTDGKYQLRIDDGDANGPTTILFGAMRHEKQLIA